MLFLCKQKTAYEMRISDGSSDVCSSELATASPRDSCRPMVIRSAYGKSDALVVSNGGHFSAQVFGLIGDASEIQEGTRGGGGSKTLNVCRYDSILAIASAPESCVVRCSVAARCKIGRASCGE